jgi:DNA-binding transcriptional MerR regulator
MEKSPEAFRTISEVAQDLGLPQHVLRFWETRFSHIRPLKRGGGRRYYRPDDVELLKAIRHLLYAEGYTIKGVQRLLKERGVKTVVGLASGRQHERTAQPIAGPLPAEAHAANGAASPASPLPWAEGREESSKLGAEVAPRAGTLPRRDFEELQTALAEISECERILAAARAV